jgi:drug/metabolite transporter (DMT)-like permease
VERRVTAVDLMLLGTVLLWALNVTVTRYAVTHGFRPLAYATERYFAATALFWGFTWHRERTFRIGLSDAWLVGIAAAMIFVNQLCFVFAARLTTASTLALMLGAIPVFTALIAMLVGLERVDARFWVAAAIAFLGVGLVAAGGGDVAGGSWGVLLGIGTAFTWSCYTVAIAPLMERYSPFRVSALVLGLGWIPLAVVSIPSLIAQSYDNFTTTLWLAFAFAVIGPLFLTNILWFTAIARVGPSRATLFTTIQPFFAVLFAIVLLDEHLNGWEIVGGVAIGAGIVLERLRKSHVRGLSPEVAPE